MQHQKLSGVLIKILDLAMCWEVHLTNILQSFGEKDPIYSTSRQITIYYTLKPVIRLIIYFHRYRNLRSLSLCRTIYKVSQEKCARLREGVPYVKVYQYNPKHLCPKLNGYGDNGQRKVWSSGGSRHCICQPDNLIHVRPWVWCHTTAIQLTLALNCLCTSFRVIR